MSNPTKSNKMRELQRKLFASRFFTTSALLHFVLVLAFGGTVLFNRYAPPGDFQGDPGDGTGFLADTGSQSPAPPDVAPSMETAPSMDAAPAAAAASLPDAGSLAAITTMATSEVNFVIPQSNMPTLNTPTTLTGPTGPSVPSPSTGGLSKAQLAGIARFTKGWGAGGGTGGSGGGRGTAVRQRKFKFTAYLAKYSGGNWNSTVRTRNEGGKTRIYSGSLQNLLIFMNSMSGGRIETNPVAYPLDLASEEIFVARPPFIFFTGHQDFVLTPKEVENLRKYINLGGCIWGDSSLPGRRSRFDIAFRREMRRVIPDTDKDWEQLPSNHAMFTKNLFFPEIKEPPAGMNYYQEPVYALKFGGEVAVIYTANDYGDMWQIGLTKDGKNADWSRDEQGGYRFLNRELWDRRDLYFRNLNVASVQASFKFGTNVVIHLLTRWEDKVANAPMGL